MTYFEEFDGPEDVAHQFADYGSVGAGKKTTDVDEILGELTGTNVICAWYSYEGCAVVVYEKDGELRIVTGSHCSCYGLEGQWNPQKTTKEVLRKEFDDDWTALGSGTGAKKVQKVILDYANSE